MLWENLREEEFRDAVKQSKGVCVVPIGCIEKHGQHLPLGTDIIIAEGLARKAAEQEPVVVFPTMYFGEKSGAREFAGTISFSLETRWHIFRETCYEIARNGFKKILFCNGHGGNSDMLRLFTRAILNEVPKFSVFTCRTSLSDMRKIINGNYPYLTQEDVAALQDFVDRNGVTGHACISETGRVYALRPETVRLDKIDQESGDSIHRFDQFAEMEISTPFAWMGDYPNSYHGTNQYVMNERIARAMAENRIEHLTKVFKFLKEETISDVYHQEWYEKQFTRFDD